ncbi:hypothetical protein GMORB2_6962 [Geosmithia morbida]|uniref:Uncharacterized protein n=1 Tax=Geosmithia morbida TaxID=1094350 RepID=A0A9P4YTR5_9HYPO|nr:uncharacterized protein GMORB2_6962 [Geosmithia morbida]KAF4122655.1 hypothetical protein GMORB2_6962 [Geosmithia morbida]
MAVPNDVTLKTFSGKYWMNKSLSGNTESVLSLQGIGFLTRKAIGLASVQLDINVYEAPPSPPNTSTDVVTHVDIVQTASGLSSTHENRTLDDTFREHSDWIFGTVSGKSTWVKLEDIEDDFLREGWEDGTTDLIQSYVESKDNGWIATQIWGFQIIDGERRYSRNVLVTKDDQRVAIKLIYDYEA